MRFGMLLDTDACSWLGLECGAEPFGRPVCEVCMAAWDVCRGSWMGMDLAWRVGGMVGVGQKYGAGWAAFC